MNCAGRGLRGNNRASSPAGGQGQGGGVRVGQARAASLGSQGAAPVTCSHRAGVQIQIGRLGRDAQLPTRELMAEARLRTGYREMIPGG